MPLESSESVSIASSGFSSIPLWLSSPLTKEHCFTTAPRFREHVRYLVTQYRQCQPLTGEWPSDAPSVFSLSNQLFPEAGISTVRWPKRREIDSDSKLTEAEQVAKYHKEEKKYDCETDKKDVTECWAKERNGDTNYHAQNSIFSDGADAKVLSSKSAKKLAQKTKHHRLVFGHLYSPENSFSVS
ncbi:unnamed protein product [Protopolystoma xenopodis]|uniref:Uncharacterized protein n=1 Tax=Protopolystoma xenopodis TaxID=117903 RepID=A0A448X1Z1_9PLAT|nr:unnamed protein product [Protopolystoma xenopodis]